MRNTPALLLAAIFMLAAGCKDRSAAPAPATSVPPPASSVATPKLRTTTPAMRTDGDTPQRHQRIVAAAAAGGHEIVFIGASIIERWETDGKERWDAVWRPRHAIDCGIGGDRTQHVLGRLDAGLLDALAGKQNSVRWIVINIGSNNTDVDSATDIAAGTRAILTKLHDRLPTARVILTMLPRERKPDTVRQKMMDLKTTLASELTGPDWSWVTMLDLWPKVLKPDGEIPAELMPDGIHPSAAAYAIWSTELELLMRGK